jgi:hypothetical protein
MAKQPIRTRVKGQKRLPRLQIYTVTVRGELPADLLVRVSAVHAQCILRSNYGSSATPPESQ